MRFFKRILSLPHIIKEGVFDGILEVHSKEWIEKQEAIQEIYGFWGSTRVFLTEIHPLIFRKSLDVFDGFVVRDEG